LSPGASRRARRRGLGVGCALVLLAAAFGARAGSIPGGVGADDALPRTVRVGTSGDYRPFTDGSGADRGGFDIAVAEAFARDAGLSIQWISFRWPDLAGDLAADRFDVAMSGVTWTPDRATTGYLTRAVAVTGPCVLGSATPKSVGVNRGGALEHFARRRFGEAAVHAVDDNASLPDLLTAGRVDAIVTDRFELRFFQRGAWPEHCEPAVDRKVYWVSPTRARDLGPRLDDWMAEHESTLDALRARWLGGSAPRTPADHVLDLLARRLALMPAVARAKAARGLATEDRAREARVVERATARARDAGLDPGAVAALFRRQIELAKRVQERAADTRDAAPALDLEGALRPALGALGDRIVAALAAAQPLSAAALAHADAAPLDVWLEASERRGLLAAVAAVHAAR
jgi:cyclohexadienyl dehydratase